MHLVQYRTGKWQNGACDHVPHIVIISPSSGTKDGTMAMYQHIGGQLTP